MFPGPAHTHATPLFSRLSVPCAATLGDTPSVSASTHPSVPSRQPATTKWDKASFSGNASASGKSAATRPPRRSATFSANPSSSDSSDASDSRSRMGRMTGTTRSPASRDSHTRQPRKVPSATPAIRKRSPRGGVWTPARHNMSPVKIRADPTSATAPPAFPLVAPPPSSSSNAKLSCHTRTTLHAALKRHASPVIGGGGASSVSLFALVSVEARARERSISPGVLRTDASARTHPVWFAMAPGSFSRSASIASRTFTFLPCVPANSHWSSTARHHQGASSSPKDASRTSSTPSPLPRSSICHVETVPSMDVLMNQGNRASGSGSSTAASASTAPACASGTRATTESRMCVSSLRSREMPRAMTCRARSTRVRLLRDREARDDVTTYASRVAAWATRIPRRARTIGSVLARAFGSISTSRRVTERPPDTRRRPNHLTRDWSRGERS